MNRFPSFRFIFHLPFLRLSPAFLFSPFSSNTTCFSFLFILVLLVRITNRIGWLTHDTIQHPSYLCQSIDLSLSLFLNITCSGIAPGLSSFFFSYSPFLLNIFFACLACKAPGKFLLNKSASFSFVLTNITLINPSTTNSRTKW